MKKGKGKEGSIWFLIIFGAGIALLIYFEVYKKDTSYYLENGYSGLINNEFIGVIKEKKVDRLDHNNTILIFKNGNKMKGLNGFFWGKMQVGDSISKVKGDYIIQVFRNGEKIILEIAPFYEKAIKEQQKNK